MKRRTNRVTTWLLAALVVGGLVAGCSDGGSDDSSPDPGSAPAGAQPPVGREVAEVDGSDMVAVTKIAQLPATLTGFAASASDDEFLVADRRGLVYRLHKEDIDGFSVPVVDPEPVLDISDEVSLLGERGMFSVKLLDDDSSVVVNYTALDGAITVEQFPYESGEPIERSTGRQLVVLPHPYAWHHGGDMEVDDEGNLYIGVGDMEFRQLDPPGPQDPDLILGGVLKVPAEVVEDPDSDWTASPSDMVARGMRNPWRLSIDETTGDMWIGDVGLDTMEEVDVIPADRLGTEVVNFGWPYYEGSNRHQGTPPEGVEFVTPVLEREQSDEGGVCGMVGGFVYRGELIEELEGRYVYGDLCGPEIRSFAVEDGEAVDDRAIAELPDETIVSMGEDSAGELYALGAQGGLYRLDPPDWAPGANEQEPTEQGPTTTLVPRSTDACDGIVDAVLPLSEMGTLTAAELEPVLTQVNADVAEVIPTLPGFLLEDALTVQSTLLKLTARLEASNWQQSAEDVRTLRDEIQMGTGDFEGFPEAMATVVDAECG